MSLNTPNSKGNVPSECPMILAIPRLAAPGVTGEIKWGENFSMSVEAEKDGRKECRVKAGYTNYSFDCLDVTEDTKIFLRRITGYMTIKEEQDFEMRRRAFVGAMTNSKNEIHPLAKIMGVV